MKSSSFEYEDYNEEKYKNNFWSINRSPYKWFDNYVKLKIFRKWASEVKNKDVFLDAGGGVGNWAFHFLKDYKKVIVLDISKEALKHIPEKEIVKKFGSVTEIPLEDKSVDCILLADVFEHLMVKDLGKMMGELNRILKDEGRVIIFTAEYGYGIGLMINRIFGRMEGNIMKSEIEEGHLNRLKYGEIRKIVAKGGFGIEDYNHSKIIFQQIANAPKDILSSILQRNKGATRKGQIIKDKLKQEKEPNPIMKLFLTLLSYISYLDIILFGKIIPGEAIFLKLKKIK